MKLIVSGGGTGGHIYPALAIADEMKRRYQDIEILYVGCDKSLEKELATLAGYKFASVEVKGMPRKFSKEFYKSIRALLKGLGDSKKIIKAFKPDVVVGTGGYVSFPILYKAHKAKIPILLQEQNAYPGIANKLLSRYADTICVAYDEAEKLLKYPEKCVKTGNPIRAQFIDSIEDSKWDGSQKTVLIFGGSGGQSSLNRAVLGAIPQIKDANFKVYHITGKNHYGNFMEMIANRGLTVPENLKLLEYSHDLPRLLKNVDLVVTSSSAMALSEISYLGKPSILIPKSYTAENHQVFNAKVYENEGAAKLILEKDLNPDNLISGIKTLLYDDNVLKLMGEKSAALGVRNATAKIADEVEKLVYRKHF